MKPTPLYLALLTGTLLLSACDKTPTTDTTTIVTESLAEAKTAAFPSYSPTQF